MMDKWTQRLRRVCAVGSRGTRGTRERDSEQAVV